MDAQGQDMDEAGCISCCVLVQRFPAIMSQVLSKNAQAGITGDPDMAVELMSKDAIKTTYKCCVCSQVGKGKVDLVRHFASRVHSDAIKALGWKL